MPLDFFFFGRRFEYGYHGIAAIHDLAVNFVSNSVIIAVINKFSYLFDVLSFLKGYPFSSILEGIHLLVSL